ncbi:MAG: imidazole glycerol phosphate synthase subunit HisH [Campylobacterales bacterium]|nr:imidazole glycerol phosphate synthase subunit HisH [Campylobacterales bacterium]
MIGVIDYGAGNIKSLQNGFEYLGEKTKIISEKFNPHDFSHLILPGVGAFCNAMDALQKRDLQHSILEFVNDKKPFLGICLGMQLLCTIGHEPFKCDGLGIIEGECKKLQNTPRTPHVGWNNILIENNHKILKGIKKGCDFYFVHSYFVECDEKFVVAKTEYGTTFNSIIAFENIIGIQFHPEKSQENGLKILENFVEMDKYA